jgi:uncharacterized protein YecT (DUF1311 family)
MKTPLFVILSVLLLLPTGQAQQPRLITESEIRKAIVAEHADCKLKDIYFHRLLYHDFVGDGEKDAVVVASTCDTGTAGPDVHSVYSRDADGKVVELRLPNPPPETYDVLLGSSNSDLRIEKGLLVEDFADYSYRKHPLIIRYKWDGTQFVLASIKKPAPFQTSFDCAKAVKDVEKVICYIEPLAQLDQQLAAVYRERLKQKSLAERKSLREEQRAWLQDRDRVAVYKYFMEPLEALYRKRIAELSSKPAS